MEITFGKYIRTLRKESKLTLTELAAQLKLDSGNLSKIERGIREFDEKRLDRLAEVFKLDLKQLKVEFFSEKFAKKIMEYNCPSETLSVAEEKVKYITTRNKKTIKYD